MAIFLSEVEPILSVASLFGHVPYSSTKRIALTKFRLAYSLLWFCALCIFSFLRSMQRELEQDYKLRVLSLLRTSITILTLCANVMINILWNNKLQRTSYHLKLFDLSLKFNGEGQSKIYLRPKCWIALWLTLLIVTLLSALTYCIEQVDAVLVALVFWVINVSSSVSLFNFVFIVSTIYVRFRHLNSLLVNGKHQLTSNIVDCTTILMWYTYPSLLHTKKG